LKKLADKIRKVGLLGNSEKTLGAPVIASAAKLLRAAGREICTDVATANLANLNACVLPDAATLCRQVDLLLVFGGDGTMLRIAREIAGSRTPILGINIGGLGFLTAVPSDEMAAALKRVWKGEFRFENRTLLQATGTSSGNKIDHAALNDIVISRGISPRLIELEVKVNGEALTRYRCDGLIINSPTGSTAYALAAGGAVVFPTADAMGLTPICPHTLSNRSLILPLSATVEIEIITETQATMLSADGQVVSELTAGDLIIVKRSRRTVLLMQLEGSSFCATLRQKLHWRGASL
jgi:NAD+ kinase